MSDPEMLVIGGGIAGMSSALFCARKGYDVSLFEKDELGGGATNAAAGVLMPPSFLDRSRPDHTQNSYALLSEKGYRFYPDFIDLLDSYSMIETGYAVCGTWHLGMTEKETESLKTYYDEMTGYNREVEWADGDALRGKFPFLSDEVRGGYCYAEEGQVDPVRLTQALRDALRKENVSLHEHEAIQSLTMTEEGRCSDVHSDRKTYTAERVLVAAGCWSNEFGSTLNQEIRVEPRKGQMIKLSEDLGTGPMFEWNEIHVVPRMDGTVDAGATVEDAGYDTNVTQDARNRILTAAERMFPSFSTRSVIDQWAGLRPYARRKGGPFLGRVPETKNVFINAGHYQKGILQGPFTGRLIAQLINGETPDVDVHPYRVDR